MRPFISGVFVFFLMACGSNPDKSAEFSFDDLDESTPTQIENPASTRIDLENKGVGAITSVYISESVDEILALKGEVLYEQKCTACHKVGEKFVGPPPNGILKRRTPEWVMNMILDPERMLKEDPLAKELFMEFNGAPMANQGLTAAEARAILEFFRTLD